MKIGYETSRIFALDQLGLCRFKDFIDWGLRMLQDGSTSTDVAILAGINPQTSYFEVKQDFLQALHDLGIEFKMGGEAMDLYLEQAAEKIIAGSIPYKEILKVAYDLHLGRQSWNSKYDTSSLLNLYWAIEDLEHGDQSWSYYYEDLNAMDPGKSVSLECQIMLGRITRNEPLRETVDLPFKFEKGPTWFERAKEMLTWLFGTK